MRRVTLNISFTYHFLIVKPLYFIGPIHRILQTEYVPKRLITRLVRRLGRRLEGRMGNTKIGGKFLQNFIMNAVSFTAISKLPSNYQFIERSHSARQLNQTT